MSIPMKTLLCLLLVFLMCLCGFWLLQEAKWKVKSWILEAALTPCFPCQEQLSLHQNRAHFQPRSQNSQDSSLENPQTFSTNTVKSTFKLNVPLIPLMFSNPDTLHVSLNTSLYLIPKILRHLMLTWIKVKRFACSLPGNQSLIPHSKKVIFKRALT